MYDISTDEMYAEEIDRLVAMCDRDGDCLIWTGVVQPSGAPKTKLGSRAIQVRRYMHFLHTGTNTEYGITTSCKTPRCIEFSHLVFSNGVVVNPIAFTPASIYQARSERGRHKLSDRARQSLVRQYGTGNFSMRDLAREYNISVSSVHHLIHSS